MGDEISPQSTPPISPEIVTELELAYPAMLAALEGINRSFVAGTGKTALRIYLELEDTISQMGAEDETWFIVESRDDLISIAIGREQAVAALAGRGAVRGLFGVPTSIFSRILAEQITGMQE